MVACRPWLEPRLTCMPVTQVASIEAHGTGTKLGDPTEVGALTRCFGDCHEAPKAIGASKASMGHSEPVAGHLGVMHVVRSLSYQALAANAQLRTLNRLLPRLLASSEVGLLLPAQGVEDHGQRGLGGVSSFGYSGTIAHSILQSCGQAAQATLSTGPDITFRRHRFPWHNPSHPLLQQRLAQSPGLAAFRSPTVGRLHALVSEHVVQGRVVFPGAAYLEAARAAWSASTSPAASLVGLHGVFFLQPLDVGLDSAVAFIDCVLYGYGTFEVRSGDEVALQGSDAPMHCTGTASASAPPQQLVSLAARRSGCALTDCVGAQYDMFHTVGLQYGPSYRQLQQAWACEQRRGDGVWCGAVARLRRRLGLQAVVVHPADLDGSIQLGQFSGRSEVAGKMLLPFALDAALLEGGAVEQWAVRAHALAPTRAYIC